MYMSNGRRSGFSWMSPYIRSIALQDPNGVQKIPTNMHTHVDIPLDDFFEQGGISKKYG